MSQDITDFIAAVRDAARGNKFEVVITWPTAVGSPSLQDKMVIRAASMPAYTTGVLNLPYMGRQIPIPGDRTYEPWTCTVLNDISMSHRNRFEKWQDLINGQQSNLQGTTSYKELVTTIEIIQYDRNDNILAVKTLNNAWPSNVSAIELAYDQNDQEQTYTVTFVFTDAQNAAAPTT